MVNLFANILNESDKIFQRKKNLAFLMFSVVIVPGAGALFAFGEKELGIFAVTSSAFSILILSIFTSVLLPIFIFSISAELFSGEIGDKTIKATLTRPISRFKVYLSKIISIGLYIIITLCLVLLTSALTSSVLGRGLIESDALSQTVLAYFVAIVPMIFLIITAAFVNQFFSNSGAALSTLIIMYIGAKITPFLSPTLGKINPFSFTDWHIMWVGNQIVINKLFSVFSIFAGGCLILFAAGFLWFDRRDI